LTPGIYLFAALASTRKWNSVGKGVQKDLTAVFPLPIIDFQNRIAIGRCTMSLFDGGWLWN